MNKVFISYASFMASIALTAVALSLLRPPLWMYLVLAAMVVAANVHGRYCGRLDVADAVRKVISSKIMNGHAPTWTPVRKELEVILPK